MKRTWMLVGVAASLSGHLAMGQTASAPAPEGGAKRAAGFSGVWYTHEAKANDPEPSYSGGLATFSPQHVPMAICAEKAKRTFFVYGGSDGGAGKDAKLQICISFFDHSAGELARPVVIVERTPADAHANPAISIDTQGYLWVFVPATQRGERGDVFKSRRANDIRSFERVAQMTFSYPQPWHVEGKGFVFVFTRFQEDHPELCSTTSPDGMTWSEPKTLASIQGGCDAVSWRYRAKIGVAFNYHPTGGVAATGLYYIESADAGQSWTTARHEPVKIPLKETATPALVFDYGSTAQAVSLKDLNFDAMGNPTILYMVTRGGAAAPTDPLLWMTARWLARGWRISGLIQSDHVCDGGVLSIENRSDWRILAATGSGSEPGKPGGEMVSWTSDDFGRAWARTDLTRGSEFNHNYVRRPVDAQPEFGAFWSDGAVRRPSDCRLYFATHDGKVFRMPPKMRSDSAKPDLVSQPPGAADSSATKSTP